MKFISLQAVVLMAIFLTSATFAGEVGYKVIVDAGSSGSRVHLFRYTMDGRLPDIQDIFTEKNKLPLASFASQPERAGDSLQKLLADVEAQIKLQKADPHQVSLDILGTAGMRLLPMAQQRAIYSSLKNYMRSHSSLKIGDFSTISGKMEGVYDWLDVNYLGHYFESDQETVGAIDMGGASTQLVFETQDQSKSGDEVRLNINGQTHLVFAKSFLGLGMDQVRQTMNQDVHAMSCYPIGTPGVTMAQYDFASCQNIYENLITQNYVADNIIPIGTIRVVAFSGVYYTYHFFNIDSQPDAITVENKIRTVCSKTWNQLKTDYPNEADNYLSTYCANGSYIEALLSNTYHLKGPQLQVVSEIDHKNIDWVVGAMLYQLIEHS